ncbi:helix-turn-helix domain-containing protein [Janthinobacterium sp. RB2R34]|uniref:helix-turn-helix domain-containing protein n=1 Tax=Janthinobacterium sp. RB2R34 TaxID=3424193 RepID=UPI003F29CDCA
MVAKKISDPVDSLSQAGDLATRLSRNLAARRRVISLTQAQVAERLGVDTETVSRFERGKHVPSLLTLERMAAVLATSVGELLAEKPNQSDDQSLVITSWMAALGPDDQAFAQALLKQCCDYLAVRTIER